MERRTILYLLTLLLPHKLTLETYRLRDSLWKASGNVSTKVLPPCVPLLPMQQGEPIPGNIGWRATALTVSTTATVSGRAVIMPLLPEQPLQDMRFTLQESLGRPYDDDVGELFGIPALATGTGIYLSTADTNILQWLQANDSSLPPLDDARLALLRCIPAQEGTLEQGAQWSILEQKHLADRLGGN